MNRTAKNEIAAGFYKCTISTFVEMAEKVMHDLKVSLDPLPLPLPPNIFFIHLPPEFLPVSGPLTW